MEFLLHILDPWCWRMAWRDSRKSRWRLISFSFAIMAGIAALVMVGSLREGLLRSLDSEARAMLGADAYLFANRPVTDKAEELIKGLPAKVLKETGFTAMARVVAREADSKLVQARAVEEGWPYFGKPTTEPADAWDRCLAGEGFVIDGVLEETLTLRAGDRLKLGELELPVLGVLRRPPPQVSLMTQFAPELFLAYRLASQSSLSSTGAGTFHRRWLLFPEGYDVEKQFVDKLKKPLRSEGVNVESVAQRKKNITQIIDIVNSFLSLMAFVALVLGGMGVASAIHVHSTERLPVVATLRCLGCTANRAMAVYVIQGLWLGMCGALGGVALGAAAVYGAAAALRGIVPVPIEADVSGWVVAQGLIFGFLLCVCFALLPLLQVRRTPAMAAVRASVIAPRGRWSDPANWIILMLVAGALVWLAVSLSPSDFKVLGVAFCGLLVVGLLLLAGVAVLVMRGARRIVRPWWPFTLRMGLAGLHRPRNQTFLFLLSVGIGVSMVLSTLLTESMLVSYLNSWDVRMKENFFAINIAPEQRQKAVTAMREAGAEVKGEAPVALFGLQAVNGKSLDQLQDETGKKKIRGWFLTHIYRVSWDEKLPPLPAGETVSVSLEKSVAESFRISTGAKVTFNHSGRPIECVVTKLHEPDIAKMLDNFPILIVGKVPPDLYVTWALGAHIESAAEGVRVQRALTAAVPGATIFDIVSISAVVEKLISRGARVIHWLSMVTVFTGLVIVAAVLMAGRRDRVEESVLLRTLGASRGQIRRILVTEYLLLGFFAAVTGALLSLGFAWLLAWLVFKIPFDTWQWPLLAAVGIVSGVTTAMGMMLSRGVASHPPLAILRGEG